MNSRLSIAAPGVALALFAIAAAQTAPTSPRPPVAQASEPAPVAAKHLSEMEARMKLMQQQMTGQMQAIQGMMMGEKGPHR